MMQPRFILVLVGFGLACSAHTQGDCSRVFRETLDRIEEKVRNAPGMALFTEVEMTTAVEDNGVQRTTEVVEMAASKDRTLISNPAFAVYEDRTARVVVLPKDSMVYIYDQGSADKTPTLDYWKKFNDLVLTSGRMANCRNRVHEGVTYLDVEWRFDAEDKRIPLKKLHYTLDVTGHLPVSIKAEHAEGAAMLWQQVRYLKFLPGKLDPRLAADATANVLRNGKLRPAFLGFQLRDMRQNKISHVVP